MSMQRPALIILVLTGAGTAWAGSFEESVQPILARHCLDCHNDKVKNGKLSLQFADGSPALSNRDFWDKVMAKLRTGEMPPPGRPRPGAAEIAAVAAWFEGRFA